MAGSHNSAFDNFDLDSFFVTWQPPLASWGSLQLDFGRSMECFPFSPEARYVVPDSARKTENEMDERSHKDNWSMGRQIDS